MTTPVSPPADLAQALSGRYELRDALGRGGMAVVYHAFDRKHQREVALKVLRPDISATIGADRFLAEIRIVARLVHPHILTLHDSGESDGFVYYVMPLVDSGSLRDVMQRQGRMTAERAIAIAAPIGDALAYAHQCGVLHRDIKPENVLFMRAHPIVADFGIAKAVHSANSGARLTRTGISLGTPGYMSPEQAAGFNDVDERTDVYALAILVYEMIVGEIPGRWVTEESTRVGRFLDCAAAHRVPLSAAGPVVEGALVRALALRPDQRTATPSAFIEELRGQAPSTRRKYRPDEIQAIVNRAAEIEATNPTQSGALTMGGVEALAAEVGIGARHVRSAAGELATRPYVRDVPAEPPSRNIFLGGATRASYERVLEGELNDADFAVLVAEIRANMEEAGMVSQLGRSFTWTLPKGSSGTRNVEISVSVRAGRTRIVVQERFNNLIEALFVGGGVGGGLGGLGAGFAVTFGALGLPPIAAVAVVPAWLATVYATIRASYRYVVKRREVKLEALADRLAWVSSEMIRESQPALPRD